MAAAYVIGTLRQRRGELVLDGVFTASEPASSLTMGPGDEGLAQVTLLEARAETYQDALLACLRDADMRARHLGPGWQNIRVQLRESVSSVNPHIRRLYLGA